MDSGKPESAAKESLDALVNAQKKANEALRDDALSKQTARAEVGIAARREYIITRKLLITVIIISALNLTATILFGVL